MNIIFFYIIVASATDIITRSKIADIFKKNLIHSKFFRELLNCPICFGFWFSLFLSMFYYPIYLCWAYGLAGSLFSNVYRVLIDHFDNKINF